MKTWSIKDKLEKFRYINENDTRMPNKSIYKTYTKQNQLDVVIDNLSPESKEILNKDK